MKRELSISAGMIALTLISFYLMYQIEIPEAQTFPKVVLSIMMLLGVFLGIQAIINKKPEEASKGDKKPYPIKKVAIALCCMIVYFAVMETVGFYLSGFIFFFVVTLVLQEEKITPKGAAFRGITCLAFMGVLFILFNNILAVQAPRGIFY